MGIQKKRLPPIIDQRNYGVITEEVARLTQDREAWSETYDGSHWLNREVTLEFALGELAEDGFKTIALVGTKNYTVMPLTGGERWNAQGIEGKVIIRKPLREALANIQILKPYRWRIITTTD